MKKQEDARLAGLREYDRWTKDHPNDAKKMGGYVFFGYLEKERPDLLDFRAAGSKWQIVHLWLRHGRESTVPEHVALQTHQETRNILMCLVITNGLLAAILAALVY
jgi:hypothetical protein